MSASSKTEEQKDLVSLLYAVHDKLRVIKSQSKTDQQWKQAWREHTSDSKTLQDYSKAMHELATKIWEPRNSLQLDQEGKTETNQTKSVKLKCRLEWVVKCCDEYFGSKTKLKLLDVGSCYNPFSKYFSVFDVVAVDLCPAPGHENSIFQCDFLEVELTDKINTNISGDFQHVSELPQESFDVVVFSYFLEYLADERQRVESCMKAFNLLRPNGLLFVLRPDSSKVTPGGNNVLMKKMKVGMVLLGFKRIFFEKLEHLWCMAFKKLEDAERLTLVETPYFKKDVDKVGAGYVVEDNCYIHELFCIAQDFKHRVEPNSIEDKCTPSSSSHNHNSSENFFCELPCLEVGKNGWHCN